jgi:hypothetical protein
MVADGRDVARGRFGSAGRACGRSELWWPTTRSPADPCSAPSPCTVTLMRRRPVDGTWWSASASTGGHCSAPVRASISPSCSSGSWPATPIGVRRPAHPIPRWPDSLPPTRWAASVWPRSPPSSSRRRSPGGAARAGRPRWCLAGGRCSARPCPGRSPSGCCAPTHWRRCGRRPGRCPADTSCPARSRRCCGPPTSRWARQLRDSALDRGRSRFGGAVRRRADPVAGPARGRHRRSAR